ncbi:uncharacterized protein HD556DRAFT_819862 [Suillus plorans]|uniref:Uncharacterized protein n=1 Tax=Suillus plorans TaxID=116603 RepID=A0A9P7AIV9_9AGAM|nr:uncharacterized protein HD556DRAFT_819862 [Suillus plorans]KAG1789303.1 hypothetical protein HD556DRAFT_819862 [Suillus plorans]
MFPLEYFLKGMNLHEMKKYSNPPDFFVMEAKLFNPLDHIAQAASEMFACGRFLERRVIRGALTNGYQWIFLIMTFADDCLLTAI